MSIQPEKTNPNWFFTLLERLAATHGVRALGYANLTARGLYARSDQNSSSVTKPHGERARNEANLPIGDGPAKEFTDRQPAGVRWSGLA